MIVNAVAGGDRRVTQRELIEVFVHEAGKIRLRRCRRSNGRRGNRRHERDGEAIESIHAARSPATFTERAVTKMNRPGKSASHGSVPSVDCAWYSMFPQLA